MQQQKTLKGAGEQRSSLKIQHNLSTSASTWKHKPFQVRKSIFSIDCSQNEQSSLSFSQRQSVSGVAIGGSSTYSKVHKMVNNHDCKNQRNLVTDDGITKSGESRRFQSSVERRNLQDLLPYSVSNDRSQHKKSKNQQISANQSLEYQPNTSSPYPTAAKTQYLQIQEQKMDHHKQLDSSTQSLFSSGQKPQLEDSGSFCQPHQMMTANNVNDQSLSQRSLRKISNNSSNRGRADP